MAAEEAGQLKIVLKREAEEGPHSDEDAEPPVQKRARDEAAAAADETESDDGDAQLPAVAGDEAAAQTAVSASSSLESAASSVIHPWGMRPSFRQMLAGGSKKLVLFSPPDGVTDYFATTVYRPFGCTYDNATSTFFATSPGDKGRSNGQVVAMSGNCQAPPVIVTSSLDEPAAIAVYEPELSVCVVTNSGIFVFTRMFDEQGAPTDQYAKRQISSRKYHRGIATTAGSGIVSFSNGRIRMFDGMAASGEERVITEANYDTTIDQALFWADPIRRSERGNCCFMDIVDNRLVMSDLRKHVISLWRIDEDPAAGTAKIQFVRAIDVAIGMSLNSFGGTIPGAHIAPGKCAFAAGVRLDAEGWVLCADANGRTIQIYDNYLKFVTRVESPDRLPYISGLCIESAGHLMVCDRKSENGLRVYIMEAVDIPPPRHPPVRFY